MPSSHWLPWLKSKKQPTSKRSRKSGRVPLLPLLELLEDRTLPAVLPAALVNYDPLVVDYDGDSTTPLASLPFGLNPASNPLTDAQVAINPMDPSKVVVVASYNPTNIVNGPGVVVWHSTDAGLTWDDPDFILNESNPQLLAGITEFPQNEHPNVAFDTLNNFYVISTQHTAGNTAGAIVLSKFDFSGGSPDQVDLDPIIDLDSDTDSLVLYRWHNSQDAAYNPTVAVNTNLPTFTDPDTGATQVDSLANTINGNPKAIYAAWNTNFVQPTGSIPATLSRVVVTASGDGGFSFTTTQYVSGFSPAAAPQIVFSQGSADGRVPGGQLMFFWSGSDDDLILDYDDIVMDVSRPDNGVPDRAVATAQVFANNDSGTIFDATTAPQSTRGSVASLTLTAAGTGFTGAPTLQITPPPGSPPPATPPPVVVTATGTAATTGTPATPAALSGVTLTNGGRGYTTTPMVTVVGGGGTGAVVTANMNIQPQDAFEIDVNLNDPAFTTLADLDVTLNIISGNVAGMQIILFPPNNAGIPAGLITNGLTLATGLTGANMGAFGSLAAGANNAGTVFDSEAERPINDPNAANSGYVGHFRPIGDLSQFYDLTASQLNGIWSIEIIDSANNGIANGQQFLNGWSLNFTSNIDTNGFGDVLDDEFLPSQYLNGISDATTVEGDFDHTHLRVNAATGTPGAGPGIRVAIDNSLGSFSPNQGTIYVAYTGYASTLDFLNRPNDTDIFLMKSTDGGQTWTDGAGNEGFQTRVNDDSPSDNFSEGIRPQFKPSIAVDQTTGTLLISYYDARWDAAQARVTTYLATSLDGGETFGPQTYLNEPKTATDAITGAGIILEPIPGNQGQAGAFGFGGQMGLAASGGRVYAAYSSNTNETGARIYVPQVTIAGGPRIVYGDMGPVVTPFSSAASATVEFGGDDYIIGDILTVEGGEFSLPTLLRVTDVDGSGSILAVSVLQPGVYTAQPPNPAPDGFPGVTVTGSLFGSGARFSLTYRNYNSSFAGDGTRQFTGFVVQFDRPVDPTTFDGDDVTVQFRDTQTAASLPATLTLTGNAEFTVTPLNLGAFFGVSLLEGNPLASAFLVTLNTPLSNVGTYSYAISPAINDRIRLGTSTGGGGGTSDTISQFASSVIAFSSEFNPSPGSFSAAQALGPPDVFTYGDDPNAWSPENQNGPPNPEFLTLGFTTPVFATGITVRESFQNGFVAMLEVRNAATGVFSTVFNGVDPSLPGSVVDFAVNFARTTFLVDAVRVTVNPLAGPSWEEIDSVQLRGDLTFTATGAANTNLPVPPTGSGGSAGGFPTLPTLTNEDTQASTITVSGLTQPVSDVNVRVRLPHEFNGDLNIRLIAPDGTIVPLSFGNGGGDEDGYADVIFDDQATVSVTTTAPPYGRVRPQSLLAVLNGLPAAVANGNWILQINDDAGGDVGTLIDWSITFNSTGGGGGGSTVTNAGNLVDQDMDAFTGEDPDDVFAIPKPVNGVPFQLPYTNDTLPLVVPGPHVVNTRMAVATAAVFSGGTGYSLNGQLTVQGGAFTTPAQLRISAVGADVAAVAVGGTGYAVGDILIVQTGTFTFPALLEVTSVSGGAVTGVAILDPGSYSALPVNPVNVSAGTGVGTGARFNLSFGFVTEVTVTNPGQYSLAPNNPAAVSGTGVGARVNLTYNSGPENLILNGQNNSIDVTFDRSMNPASMTSSNVLRIVGPVGAITPYNAPPTVTFSAPPAGGGNVRAQGIALIDGTGRVTGIVMTNQGSGYVTAPTVTFTGATGSGATATTTLTAGRVTAVTITNGGSNYSMAPLAIPDNGAPLDATLRITDSLVVNDLGVRVNVVHPNVASLSVSLVSPAIFGANGAAVATPGTGYAVGNVLTVQGGTFTTPAQLTVTTVSGGTITGVTVTNPGAYTVLPTGPVSVTGGAGVNARFNVSFVTTAGGTVVPLILAGDLTGANLTDTKFDGYVDDSITQSAAPHTGTFFVPRRVTAPISVAVAGTGYSLNDVLTVQGGTFTTPAQVRVSAIGAEAATIATAGTGYAVGNVLTVQGGTFTTAAQLRVTSVMGGVITGVTIINPGSYTALPTGSVTVTGGTGTGARFNLTFGAVTGVTLIQPGTYTEVPSGTVSVSGGTGSLARLSVTFTNPLSAFNGQNYAGPGGPATGGDWILRITDADQDGITGTLTSWGLNPITVTANPEGRLAPTFQAPPLVSFSAPDTGTDRATGVAVIDQSGRVLAINVTHAGSGYATAPTVTITGKTGTGATAAAVLTGGGVSGVNVLTSGTAYTMPAQVIPDVGVLTTDLDTLDPSTVNDLSVAISVTHPEVFSLDVKLVSPGGQVVTLVPFLSVDGPNFTDTRFDDGADTSILRGAAPYAGTFRIPRRVESVVIAVGGSGYTVGDTLTLLGGVFDSQAQVQVTSVNAFGAITGVTLVQGGLYATEMGATVGVMGGTGTGAQLTTTLNKSLGDLDGETYSGTGAAARWRLMIEDRVADGVSGTLDAWSLNPVPVGLSPNRTFRVTFPTQTRNGTYNVVFGTDAAGNAPKDTSVSAASVVTAGNNYHVGDVLEVQGGTFDALARLKVTAVAAATAAVVTGGTGYSLNGLVTVQGGAFTTPAQLRITAVGADVATVAIAGNGYAVGDVLTVQGGTFTTPAQLTVTAVSGGLITAVTITNPGSYTVRPTSPVTVTGGSGTAARFNLSFGVVTAVTVSTPGLYSAEPTNPVAVTGTGTGATFNLTYAVGRIFVVEPGSYVTPPANPVSVVNVVGGVGSGATFNLTHGHLTDNNLDAGVNLLRGNDPNNTALVPRLFDAGTLSTPLPAGSTVSSPINVNQAFVVQGVTVTLSLLHQNIPDLQADLISPDGMVIRLFTNVGTSGSVPHANFTNATFDDAATLPIQLAATFPGTGIGPGSFNPQLPLSRFKGGTSLGTWTLRITNNSAGINGTLTNWKLTLRDPVPGSGLGDRNLDDSTGNFRIFTQDPTEEVSQQAWTPIGPAPLNGPSGVSGKVGALAVDPSDRSGNTVYAGGSTGGVWKTTNFLTNDPNGPTWVPLTDLGPTNSLNTGSIAVFGRNNDPNQSILFVATGDPEAFGRATPTQPIAPAGVGFLRSLDGGKNWRLLDSTVNAVTATNALAGETIGTILAFDDPRRDHVFRGSIGFEVTVDPTPRPDGSVAVYAALYGPAINNGLWRSLDSGLTWTRVRAGNATDVVLAAGSASAGGSLQILYAAFEGEGVFFTSNAPAALNLISRNVTGDGTPFRRDVDNLPDTEVPLGNRGVNPGGGSGRVLLAAPARTGNPLEDTLYQGYLYAEVTNSNGTHQNLYVTKDFGLNWTAVRIPITFLPSLGVSVATNDEGGTGNANVVGADRDPGNYHIALTIDPNNPNVVYLAGSSATNPFDIIRVDVTNIIDPWALYAFDNSADDGGQIQTATTGGVTIKSSLFDYGIVTADPFSPWTNQLRDPSNPFLTPSSLQYSNVANFVNTGVNVSWGPMNPGFFGTDYHELLAIRDPLTGATRLLAGNDYGVWTTTDRGDGTVTTGIGVAYSALGNRNGNLQLAQFYDGAAQPSALAADLAGAMFYAAAEDLLLPIGDPRVLDNGNLGWTDTQLLFDGHGDGVSVETDATGSGTAYLYKSPVSGAHPLPSDFFLVQTAGSTEISRITGLLQSGDNPGTGAGQWPALGGSEFAVNPIDSTSIVMSSRGQGRLFLTTGPTLGTGVQWFPIANPGDVGNAYAPAVAFGAPASATAPLSDFIYAGNVNGQVFVTTVGGGAGGGAAVWRNISTGLAGGGVQQIVTSPTRGTREAYAVTSTGVFWMPDSGAAAPTWVNVTGNLFSVGVQRSLFNDPAQLVNTILGANLFSIQADWRYAITDSTGAIAITSVTQSGTTVRVTTAAAHGLTANQRVEIAGVGVAGYNGLIQITGVPSATTFEFTAAPGLAPSSGGTVTGTHPVLYVGGNGGVLRSLDKGTTWTHFPDRTIDGALQQGDQMPTVAVTALDLSLGNVNPATGQPDQSTGRNLLLATTFGRGSFVIRLNEDVVVPGTGRTLASYAINPVSGPRIETIGPAPGAPPLTGVQLVFDGPVDPMTFTTQDVTSLTDPTGDSIVVTDVVDSTGSVPANIFRLTFADQAEVGFYRLTLDTNVSDFSGRRINQDGDDLNGEATDDVYSARFLYQPGQNLAPSLNLLTGSFAISGVSLSGGTVTVNTTAAHNFAPGQTVEIAGVGGYNGLFTVTAVLSPTSFTYTTTARGLLPASGGTARHVDPVFDSIVEDAGPNQGQDLATFLIGGGFISDGNDAQYAPRLAPRGMAITGVDNTFGQWQYSSDGGQSWTDLTGLSPNAALLLEAVANNRLRFLPDPNFNSDLDADSPAAAAFSFRAWDLTGGLTPIGEDGSIVDLASLASDPFSTATATATMIVRPVNDVPSFTITGNPPAVNEDSGLATVPNFAMNPLAGPADEVARQVLTFQVSNSNNALFSVQPEISPTGTLTYTPAPDAFGVATVTVMLQDSGGIDDAGVDTSAAQTFTITITSVNDVPGFTKGVDQTVPEDSGSRTVNGWATGIRAGNVNATPAFAEVGQGLTFLVSNSNNALFSVQPAVSATTGALTFTTAPDAFGTATVTVMLRDDGGTPANPADDLTSPAQTFTITITSVNDAPAFTRGADQSVTEDSGLRTVNNWATGIRPGNVNATPAFAEVGQGLTFQVSNNNNALFSVQPAVSAIGTLTFTTAQDAFGTATVTVTLRDDGGTPADPTDDQTSPSQTFTITIRPVNNAPGFTKGADQSVPEDSGTQTVAGWATGISPGPSNESTQTVTFQVNNNNTALFSTQPAISPAGTLTFTPAPDALGTATVTVMLRDNGGVTDSGVDLSPPQTFTITIRPVNDVPSFTVGPNQIAVDDAGPRTVPGWTTPSAGPANESGQTVDFQVTNDNNGLFTTGGQPAVAPDGTLTFTPMPGTAGTATVTVRIHDNGGGNDGGVDLSPAQTFTITIFARPGAPVISPTTTNEDTQSSTGLVITPNPLDLSPVAFFKITGISNGTLRKADGSVISNGNFVTVAEGGAGLRFSPTANLNSSGTTFTFLAQGALTADDTTLSPGLASAPITVRPVNDVPSFTKGPNQAVQGDPVVQTVTNWATNLSAGPANESAQLLDFQVTNDNNNLFLAQPAVSPTGTLTYTPAEGISGTATVTVRIHDSGGTDFGGVDLSAAQTFTVTITARPRTPTITPTTTNEDTRSTTGLVITPGAGDTAVAFFKITGITGGTVFQADGVLPVANGSFITLAQGAAGLRFQPTTNANSSNSTFGFQVQGSFAADDATLGAAATAQITVTPVNDPPRAVDDAFTVDGAEVLPVLANDTAAPDGTETLTIVGVGTPSAGGQVAIDGSQLRYTPPTGFSGTETFTYTIADPGGLTSTATVRLTVNNAPPSILVLGTGPNTVARLRVLDARTQAPILDLQPFDAYTGGIHVAAGDVNGDGVNDAIVGAGPNAQGHTKVYDGRNGALLRSFFAYPGYVGAIQVASGDVDNDGFSDIVVGVDSGNSHVKVISGRTGGELLSFIAFPGFSGGVRLAAGDVDGDGRSEVVVLSGPTGQGHIKVFNGAGGLLRSFIAYPGYQGELSAALRRIPGEQFAQIITTATNPQSGPHVKVTSLGSQLELFSFFAPFGQPTPGNASGRETVNGAVVPTPGLPAGSAQVAAVDVNGDRIEDLVFISGPLNPNPTQLYFLDGVTASLFGQLLAFDPNFPFGGTIGSD